MVQLSCNKYSYLEYIACASHIEALPGTEFSLICLLPDRSDLARKPSDTFTENRLSFKQSDRLKTQVQIDLISRLQIKTYLKIEEKRF